MNDLATYLSQLAVAVGDSAKYISSALVYTADKKNYLIKLKKQAAVVISALSSDGNGLRVKKHLVELDNICTVTTTILSESQIALISKALLALQKEIEKDAKLMVSNLNLTPFQAALGHASLHSSPLIMKEFLQGTIGSKTISSTSDYNALISRFKSDPYVLLESMARAMRVIGSTSPQMVSKYIDDFFQFQLILDSEVFSSSGSSVFRGILNYIPDNFSDLGSDNNLDPSARDREKIRVDKRKIFSQSKELFVKLFSMGESKLINVINEIAFFVNKNLAYDRINFGNNLGGFSIPLHFGFGKSVSVCRHQALYAAVLLQAVGIPVRLLKCKMVWNENGKQKSGSHVANLVMYNGIWCLLDVTNYSRTNGVTHMRFASTGHAHVDLNTKVFSFIVESDGAKIEYVTRNNSYYRIR
jgi:hypothetical protein